MSCRNFLAKLLLRSPANLPPPRQEEEMPAASEDCDGVRTLKLLLDERNREIQLKEEAIQLLQSELEERDNLIRHLKNEIDKFRQVVRPLTQKIITQQITLLGDEPQDVSVTVQVHEQRRQRQAISAEPSNSRQGEELQIKKIAKSSK